MIDFGSVLLIILFYVVLFLLVHDASSSSNQSRRQAWSELAKRTGLTFESGNLWRSSRVTGTYRGHTLVLNTFARISSSSRNTIRDNRIVLFVNNQTNLYLALYDKTIFSRIGNLLGVPAIQISDHKFEQRFMIKGRPEDSVTRLLGDSNLRARIMTTQSFNIEVAGPRLSFEERWGNLDADYTQSLFDLLTDIAVGVEQLEAPVFNHV